MTDDKTTVATEVDRVLGAADTSLTLEQQVAALGSIADRHQRTMDKLADQQGEIIATLTALAERLARLEAPRRVRRAIGR